MIQGQKVHEEEEGSGALLEIQALMGQLDRQELMELREYLGKMDSLVQEVNKVLQEFRANKGIQARMAILGQQELRELKAIREILDPQVQQDLPAQLDQLALMVHQALQAHQAIQEQTVHLEQLVLEARAGCRVFKARVALPARRAQKEILEIKEDLDHEEQMVQRVQQEMTELEV